MANRAAAGLEMSVVERVALERVAGSSVLPERAVVMARGLVMAADGVANQRIAERLGVSVPRVRRWRQRFAAERVAGVGVIREGRGRKKTLREGAAREIVEITTSEEPPGGATQWSTRTLAKRVGVSRETVRRVWKAHGLRPWRRETFKISNDPLFSEKLVDIVGLYLDPPERAVVVCFDEKTQVQALDRTQPSLPIKRGRAQTMTHDYKRNGTSDLFAALEVHSGRVVHDHRARHTGRDVLAFFKKIDKSVPRDLDIHLVLDNLSAHKAQQIQDWLEKPRQRRWHLHFTPTSASWLNLVENLFAQLTTKCLKNGSFVSVDHLIYTIDRWITDWNENPTPLTWTAHPDDILTHVARARATLTKQNAI
jgi:transposase